MGVAFKKSWVVGNCVPNVLNALSRRHLAAPPCPITSLPHPPFLYQAPVYQSLAQIFRESFSDDSWKTGKTGIRVAQIEDSLLYDECEPSVCKSHIKTEVAPLRPTKARLIQAFVKPVDNYVVADHYRAFTHAITQHTSKPTTYLGRYIHLRSACGLNRAEIASQVSAWLLEAPIGPDNLCFIDDVSNMDGSVQMPHLLAQQELYEALSPDLAAHHKRTFRFKGVVPGRRGASTVRYAGVATVKSGAQDTSSGQTTRRIDGLVRCLCAFPTVTALRGFVFGDDVWVLIGVSGSPPALDAIALEQEKYGWKTKGVFVGSLEESSFLSCCFAHCVGGVHMFPKPGRMLAKLFWTWRRLSLRVRRAYVREIAISVLPAFQGFPFMEHWLRWHIQGPAAPKRDWMDRLTHVHPIGAVDWTGFLAQRYGLGHPPVSLFAAVSACDPEQVHLLPSHWANLVMIRDLFDDALIQGADTFSNLVELGLELGQ